MTDKKDEGTLHQPKKSRSAASRSAKEEADQVAAEMADLKRASRSAPARQEYIGTHKVVAGDTMSGIALKFYGSAVKDKWMAIYEANKELIGDNPALIHPGQELKIPKLPK